MPTRSFTRDDAQGKTFRITWTDLLNGDDGEPISFPGAGDFTVHAFGNFTGGGTVILEGTCTAAASNFFNMKDAQGNNLSFTAADGELVSEVVTHIRPRVTAGGGSTNITVVLLMRSTMR